MNIPYIHIFYIFQEQVSHFLPVFEEFLDKAPKTSSYDTVRQSVIILMGCLARHLDKADPKVKPIVIKLVDALSTPSQQVTQVLLSCVLCWGVFNLKTNNLILGSRSS